MERERLPDDRVLYFADVGDPLDGGVLEEIVVGECPIQRDVDVFVDGSGDEHAPEALVVGREVSTPSAQGDP